MKKHLEKLKNKPDHHKQKIAQTMAIIVTVIIVIIWLTILALKPKSIVEPVVETEPSIGESLESIFNNTSSELADIKEEFDQQPTLNELIQQAQEEGVEIDAELLLEQDEQTNGTRTETSTE